MDKDYCNDLEHVTSRRRIDEGRVITREEFARRKASCLSHPMPGGPLIYDLKYYLSPRTIRHRYNSIMFKLEDRVPKVFQILVSLGLPDPYQD